MSIRLAGLLTTVLGALVLATAPLPAIASVADEVAAGAAVAARLDAGQASCATLTDTQLEALGEYVMDRMVGSRAAHTAMNARMDQAIGTDNTERMHELMGRRYAGCVAGDTSSVPLGPGMMGTGAGMMGGAGWGWMRDGAWREMSSTEWQDLAGTMMGTRYATQHDRGIVVAIVLVAVLLVALLAGLLIRRSRQGPSPGTPAAV